MLSIHMGITACSDIFALEFIAICQGHFYLIADTVILCLYSTFRYAVLRFNQYFKMKPEAAALTLPEHKLAPPSLSSPPHSQTWAAPHTMTSECPLEVVVEKSQTESPV